MGSNMVLGDRLPPRDPLPIAKNEQMAKIMGVGVTGMRRSALVSLQAMQETLELLLCCWFHRLALGRRRFQQGDQTRGDDFSHLIKEKVPHPGLEAAGAPASDGQQPLEARMLQGNQRV